MKLLGVHIDDQLTFNQHINKICKRIRLKSFLNLKEKEVLVNSFIYSNFNYRPLVRLFSHKKLPDKIDSLYDC